MLVLSVTFIKHLLYARPNAEDTAMTGHRRQVYGLGGETDATLISRCFVASGCILRLDPTAHLPSAGGEGGG